MRSTLRSSRGFTLIEVLVAIGIISFLVAILLPVISRVRTAANEAVCANHIHQLMGAFISFACDNDNHLPGTLYGSNDGSYTQSDWLFGQGGFNNSPQSGTIYHYVNTPRVYRCPSLDSAFAATAQSNGRFDYAFFVCFGGTNRANIKPQSKLFNLNGTFSFVPTPILVQEEPFQVNGYNIEGDHANVDQISHIHHGGSYYGTIDGSVQWVNEPGQVGTWGYGCWQWTAFTPSGREFSLATYGGWNWWSSQ
jgi:prepilin-type N-terminal cleavage/methylation domain-containing protein